MKSLWRSGRVAEGAPLLRVYTLIAYRGFESLLLRQKQSPASTMRGIFFAVERRVRPLAGSTKRECVLDAKGGAQHLLSSFSLIAINPSHSTHQTIADAGDFFCRRTKGETPSRFDKMRMHFGRRRRVRSTCYQALA